MRFHPVHETQEAAPGAESRAADPIVGNHQPQPAVLLRRADADVGRRGVLDGVGDRLAGDEVRVVSM